MTRAVERCQVRSTTAASVSIHFPGTRAVPGPERGSAQVLVTGLGQVLERGPVLVLAQVLVVLEQAPEPARVPV